MFKLMFDEIDIFFPNLSLTACLIRDGLLGLVFKIIFLGSEKLFW